MDILGLSRSLDFTSVCYYIVRLAKHLFIIYVMEMIKYLPTSATTNSQLQKSYSTSWSILTQVNTFLLKKVPTCFLVI